MKEFVILLAGSPDAVYYPGSTVSGSVVCENSVPKNFKQVTICLKGKAEVGLRGSRSLENSIKTHNNLRAEKVYVNLASVLWTKQANVQGASFPAGIQTFPFSFRLPLNDLPPSFNGHWGSIKYTLEARIVKEGMLKSDTTTNCTLTVSNKVLIDGDRDTTLPASAEAQSTPPGCLCCTSGPIVMSVTLPRKGYAVHNDPIAVQVNVENGSYWNVNNIEVYLEKRIDFKTATNNNFQTIKQDQIYRNRPIARHTSTIYEASIVPLQDTPPTLPNCELISINYVLHVIGIIQGRRNLEVTIPIILGNTTRQQLAQYDPPRQLVRNNPYVPVQQHPLQQPGSHVPMQQYPPQQPGSHVPVQQYPPQQPGSHVPMQQYPPPQRAGSRVPVQQYPPQQQQPIRTDSYTPMMQHPQPDSYNDYPPPPSYDQFPTASLPRHPPSNPVQPPSNPVQPPSNPEPTAPPLPLPPSTSPVTNTSESRGATAPSPPPPNTSNKKTKEREPKIENGTLVTVGTYQFEYFAFTG